MSALISFALGAGFGHHVMELVLSDDAVARVHHLCLALLFGAAIAAKVLL